jgi:hypothetical protein
MSAITVGVSGDHASNIYRLLPSASSQGCSPSYGIPPVSGGQCCITSLRVRSPPLPYPALGLPPTPTRFALLQLVLPLARPVLPTSSPNYGGSRPRDIAHHVTLYGKQRDEVRLTAQIACPLGKRISPGPAGARPPAITPPRRRGRTAQHRLRALQWGREGVARPGRPLLGPHHRPAEGV